MGTDLPHTTRRSESRALELWKCLLGCMTTKQATSCCVPSHCPTSIFPEAEGFDTFSGDSGRGSALCEAAGGEQRRKRLLQHIKI